MSTPLTKYPVTFTNRPNYVFGHEDVLDQRAVIQKIGPKTFQDAEDSAQDDPKDDDGTQTPDEPENEPQTPPPSDDKPEDEAQSTVGKL